MSPILDDVCLVLITIQGFFVMYWEYKVYKINSDRSDERKAWRIAKQKAQLKKLVPDAEKKDRSQISPATPPADVMDMKEFADLAKLSEGTNGDVITPKK